MARLTFIWPYDLDGCRIVEKVPKPRQKGHRGGMFTGRPVGTRGVTLAEKGSGRPTTWIVAKRERKPEFREVLQIDGLIRRLAELPESAEGACDFVGTYGFLKKQHGPESVESITHHISVARSLVRTIECKDWPTLQRWAIDNAAKIQLRPWFIYIEDEDRSELSFGPKTLIDAIYLQALNDVAARAEFETCDNPGCPEWFRVGPGTGRWRINRGRRFCGPACQKAFAYRLKHGEVT